MSTEVEISRFSCSTPLLVDPEHSLDSTLDEKRLDQQQDEEINVSLIDKSSSLIEFEQNEKLLADQSLMSNLSGTSKMSLMKLPIFQMETLVRGIRENFNTHDENKSLNASVTCGLNEVDVDLLISKILPVESKQEEKKEDTKSEYLSMLESKVESELVRRQHCEKQIYDLNEKILELEQQLAVAHELERKRETSARSMDSSLRKILTTWKQKQAELDGSISKLKLEKQSLLKSQAKMNMKNQLLEEELKKLGSDLINEKIRVQESLNELSGLKNKMSVVEKMNEELETKLNTASSEIEKLTKIETELNEQNTQLSCNIETIQKENKLSEQALMGQIEALKDENKKLGADYNEIKHEYENLIKEAKLVVEESEKEYNKLVKNIELERIAKDSLQVELNMLEEKYETMMNNVTKECEAKMNKMQASWNEREKSLIETHRTEVDQLNAKVKLDQEKLKSKYYDDLQTIQRDYQNKLSSLNLMLDTEKAEIERLKRANKDLESERNTIRQSLKSTLELQMKETMQLLGINNNAAMPVTYHIEPEKIEPEEKKTTENKLDEFYDSIKAKINTEINTSLLSNSSLAKKSQDVQSTITASPTITAPETFPKRPSPFKPASDSIADLMSSFQTKPKETIKDDFILNQIDLINKFYQIDNKAISASICQTESSAEKKPQAAKSISNLSSLNTSEKMQSRSTLNLSQPASENRSRELKHYIEILLNKSPTSSQVEKKAEKVAEFNTPSAQTGSDKKQSIKYFESTSLSNSCSSSVSSEAGGGGDEDVDEENKRNKNYAHDISDIEVGYTKKTPHSYESYDEVKRTLCFDDDDDEEEDDGDDEDKDLSDMDQSKLQIQHEDKKSIVMSRKKTKTQNKSIINASLSSIASNSTIYSTLATKKVSFSQQAYKRTMSMNSLSNNSSLKAPTTSLKPIDTTASTNNTLKSSSVVNMTSSRKKWK